MFNDRTKTYKELDKKWVKNERENVFIVTLLKHKRENIEMWFDKDRGNLFTVS